MSETRILHALFPELLWTEGRFLSDRAVLIGDTKILAIDTHDAIRARIESLQAQDRYVSFRHLKTKALLPGFVNAHSHAFQRGIRGRTEYPMAQGGQEDFWSWRSLMYRAAEIMSPEDVEGIALAAFVEMTKTGFTHVGEFHYLHHRADGSAYDNPDEMSLRIGRAAQIAGIELTLLRTFYQRAGVERPHPEGAQRMFSDPSVDAYISSLDRLREGGYKVGVTPHSIRAVTKEALIQLGEYAQKHELPFHIHVSEQQKEIEECQAEYGCRPVELLEQLGLLGPQTTLVHAIHLNKNEIEMIGQKQCTVCSCPTTERNLGDGIVPAAALLSAGAKFVVGTDSQCQLSPFEETRQLEYHLRLRDQARSLLFNSSEQAGRGFLEMLTTNGWASLGQGPEGGRIIPGQRADLVSVDLNHLSLAGSDPESLALDLVFSAHPAVVQDVWVRGVEVVCDGFHRAQEQAVDHLRRVMSKLRRSRA